LLQLQHFGNPEASFFLRGLGRVFALTLQMSPIYFSRGHETPFKKLPSGILGHTEFKTNA
jgi:hypothetical protein